MKRIRRAYEIHGWTFVMEFSWKDKPEDWIRYDLGQTEPHKTDLNEDGSRITWIDVRCCHGVRQDGSRLKDDGTWEPLDSNIITFERSGGSNSSDTTENFDEAQRLFGVSVKWDQCAHWYFGDEEKERHGSGYWHTCGDLVYEIDAMRTAYEEAKKFMVENGTWDD